LANNEEAEERAEKRPRVARVLRFFGVKVAPAEEQWIVLTRRFPFVVLAGMVLSLIAFVGFFEFSSTPTFCATCHYIRPYVESWRESSHNMVTCTKCHFPPGIGGVIKGKLSGVSELVKTITRDQAPKPHAEIEDAACLREGCHETRLLRGKVTFKEKYHFDHTPHLTQLRRGKKLRCTSCHSQIVQGEHIAVTEEVCFTCHFKGHLQVRGPDPIAVAQNETFEHTRFADRVECWKCHSDSLAGTGSVPRQVCRDCHAEPEHLAEYENIDFMHDWHVTERKVECFQCHGAIDHGSDVEAPQLAGEYCGRCHSGDHDPPQQMFAGTGGLGVGDQPSFHSEREVDCIACHEVKHAAPTEPSVHGLVTYEATQQACIECHGEGIDGFLAMWTRGFKREVEDARAEIAKAEEALAALPENWERRSEAQELLHVARHNADFVASGRGVHNPEYALELLDRAVSAAREAVELANEAAGQRATAGREDVG
jgi:nitrate/TMAO reductase-like tetraheme cytochrome c subunit